MKMKTNSFKKNSGFTAVELVIGVIVVGLLAVLILPQLQGFIASTERSAGIIQLQKIINSSREYRSIEGTYTGITIGVLATNGYDISPLSATNAVNTFNMATTITGAADGLSATLVYPTNSSETCNRLDAQTEDGSGVTSFTCDAAGSATVVFN